MAELVDSVARRYAVLRPLLNEFQRRLWLGAEAAELGPGGVAVVARATCVAADRRAGQLVPLPDPPPPRLPPATPHR